MWSMSTDLPAELASQDGAIDITVNDFPSLVNAIVITLKALNPPQRNLMQARAQLNPYTYDPAEW